jgi:error-prone DNA polymerase
MRTADDPAVYAMIQKADTIGVFQIESRAQMSMLPRLKPATFYDLVIEVAIVRPGPIQGKMVHPYLRRRQGLEPATYPSPDVEDVLGRTLGVPLFQEQAMQLAIVAAGFTPDEADKLRRAMAAWKRKGDQIYRFGQRIIEGMLARGYSIDFAERCFEQIKGFSEYGFPESHAASFALLVYASCWLKWHHPAAFACALINSQPMGFYQPSQIVTDVKNHGVEVREVDVHHSQWDCTLEERPHSRDQKPALRLGMRLVKGLAQVDAQKIATTIAARKRVASIESLWRLSGCSAASLTRLAEGDAYRSMGLDRQAALWKVKPLRDEVLPLFDGLSFDGQPRDTGTIARDTVEEDVTLPAVRPGRQVLHDYASIGLSLKAHPMSFLRKRLAIRGLVCNSDLRDARRCPPGSTVTIGGIVLVRQRPATASGVVFISLEDETGIANLVLWSTTFEQYRSVARLSGVLLAQGRVERQGDVIHVHVQHLESLDDEVPLLDSMSRDFH